MPSVISRNIGVLYGSAVRLHEEFLHDLEDGRDRIHEALQRISDAMISTDPSSLHRADDTMTIT
jgi:hypothetical protein